jgi:hypothetical protein
MNMFLQKGGENSAPGEAADQRAIALRPSSILGMGDKATTKKLRSSFAG